MMRTTGFIKEQLRNMEEETLAARALRKVFRAAKRWLTLEWNGRPAPIQALLAYRNRHWEVTYKKDERSTSGRMSKFGHLMQA